MARMTGPDCAVMCNLIKKNTQTHTVRRQRERGRGGNGNGDGGGKPWTNTRWARGRERTKVRRDPNHDTLSTTVSQEHEKLTSDNCTEHSGRKDTKPSAKPCLSMGSTAVSGGFAILSRGQTSFLAITVKECFAFDKRYKWPK